MKSSQTLVPRRSTLITRKNIRNRFSQNLEWASEIDIATAWATPNEGLCSLHRQNPRPTVRAIVGFSGDHKNITDPDALRELADMGKLLAGPASGEKRLFHPKVYIFRRAGRSVAWIGSANFTCRGFGGNEEVLFETSDTEDVEDWFDRLWKQCQCTPLDESAIKSYEDHRKENPPPQPPSTSWEPPRQVPEPRPPGDGWIKLSECNPRPGTARPLAIRFWDESKRPLKHWNLLLFRVVEKLYAEGRLTAKDLPIPRIGKSGQKSQHRYCVHTERCHPTGREFFHAKEIKIEDGSLFVEGGMRAATARRDAQRVLDRYGQDPSTVYLQTVHTSPR